MNTAFANAFTKVFIDSDDTRALNKAYRILNEDQSYTASSNKSLNVKRLVDSDYKDVAYLKWTKSAINLHNNHVGRQVSFDLSFFFDFNDAAMINQTQLLTQMVREATQRRCRCHGLSGVCQFQTCWEELVDFETITSRLRSLYLSNSVKAEVNNYGTFEKPDLCLIRSQTPSSSSQIVAKMKMSNTAVQNNEFNNLLTGLPSIALNSQTINIDRVKPGELLYLYESPEYCEPQPKIRHPGTRGRACAPMSNLTVTETSKKSINNAELTEKIEYIEARKESLVSAPGSCEQLCCNRGYHSELVLDMVTCNCRFKYCCTIDCEHCLRQRVQHYCL